MRLVFLAAALLFAAAGACASDVPSGDGKWIARLESAGSVLAIADAATGVVAHLRPLDTRDHGKARAAAVIAVPARRSFLVALEGIPELWEIALFPEAGPFHDGFVHSYETGMEESLSAEEGLFARLRIILDAPVDALEPAPGKRYAVIGTRGDGTRVEINLAAKREVAVLPSD